eukprot:TCALIF_11823-PA protein Name:"Similar to setd7 Histone-lysine N-methyltransferase SETD7 (Halocynthia roretzi)" AED:0.00 eAED:0.00 QI:0/0.5/0.33/0.66/0.5/1/3/148/847
MKRLEHGELRVRWKRNVGECIALCVPQYILRECVDFRANLATRHFPSIAMRWHLTLILTVVISVALVESGEKDFVGKLHSIAQRDESTDDPDPEFNIKQNAMIWLDRIEREGFQDSCSVSYKKIEARNLSAVIVSPIDCRHPEARRDYEFKGPVDFDGYPHGYGSMLFGRTPKKKPEQCLRTKQLFGEDVQEIRGNFVYGYPDGKLSITLANQVETEIFFSQGIPHGPYKISIDFGKPTHVFTVGAVYNGLQNDPCWIVTETEIRYGNCSQPFVFESTSSLTVVFPRSLQQDFVPVSGQVKENTLSPAFDATLLNLRGYGNCSRILASGIYPHEFVYDLTTKERMFRSLEWHGICPDEEIHGRDKAAQGFRSYLSRLTHQFILGQPFDEATFKSKKGRKLITNLEQIEHNRYEAVLNLEKPHIIEFRYFGPRDAEDNFHGYGEIQIIAKNTCYRGVCEISKFTRLFGHFGRGKLQGPFSIIHRSQWQSTMGLAKDGIIHGLVATFGLVPVWPYVFSKQKAKESARLYMHSGIGMLAWFDNGREKTDFILRGTVADPKSPGFLYGSTTKGTWNITGDHTAWLYPYYVSALVGKFDNNMMVSAQYAHLKSFRCDYHMPRFTFTEPSGSSFFFDPPTNETVTSQPLLADPYDAELVEVRESKVPGAGEGVYALKDIQPQQLFAMYAGIQVDDEQTKILHENYCNANLNGSYPCDKYSIATYMGANIYLPTPWHQRDHNCATSAAKINNDFEPNVTSRFVDIEHPRFGLIMGTECTKPIKAGEEILIDYGYKHKNKDLEESIKIKGNHQWYFIQKKAHLERLEKLKKHDQAIPSSTENPTLDQAKQSRQEL